MLDLKKIIKEPKIIIDALKARGADWKIIDDIVTLSQKRSEVMSELQKLEADRNNLSKEIGILKSRGENADNALNKVSNIKGKIDAVRATVTTINDDVKKMLFNIPNTLSTNTPIGDGENDNVIIAEHKDLGRGLVTGVVPHYEIGQTLDIVDFERAVKLSGKRFWAYKGLGAKLVRALENFMLDVHVENGYEELRPPLLVNNNALIGTGQLPKFSDDLFKVEGQNLYLIPTAEVPITNFYSNEIIDLETTESFVAFTPCFRAEAGSGGKDMRGLIRSHQFNKVELVKITTEENKRMGFKNVLDSAKSIIELLDIPYREVQLCSGDIGFSAEETVDLEIWIPSENKYREVSSISSFGDYQSRRAMIRYKDDGVTKYANTINGSGVAIDRVVAAILENYQNKEGTITVPKVLIKYMNVDIIQ